MKTPYDGDEQDGDEIFDLLSQGNCKAIVVGYDETGQETT
jgi:hypothetical protein